MAWWKALLVNIVLLSAAAAFTVLSLRVWLERREERKWPLTLATITGYKQGPGHKGRPATYLAGHTSPNGQGQVPFTVEWGICDLRSGAWVPPPNTPPIGSTIRLLVDPGNPAHVALIEGPRVTTGFQTFWQIAVIDFGAIAGAVAMWFI